MDGVSAAPNALHSVLLFVMILLILTGRRGGVYEARLRARQDRAGVRAALIAEFTALQGVYRLNMDLIAAGAPQLISGKPYFSIYRGNMHRLMALTPAEISAVVTAHAASNTLESAVTIGLRMRMRASQDALWEAKGLDLWRLQRIARHTARDALRLLEEQAALADAALLSPWWQRAWIWARARQRRRAGLLELPAP